MMIEPSIQMTSIGQMKLPHWILKTATVSGASSNNAQMPKFDGFHR